MSVKLIERARAELESLEAGGLRKHEREITTPQSAHIGVAGREVLNLCANNYLGLADDRRLEEAAKRAIDSHGLGMASVRFICGTSDIHRLLERRIAEFLGTEAAVLFPSCFDANGGLFEALLGAEDAVISDALNHASIIDGIRLSKAQRFRYANNDMAQLETRLIEARDARTRLIVTDGVFSMDGIVANLPRICELAEEYDALVMVDDSHATGVLGARGAGTPEHFGVAGRVHLVTSTFGKALGGAGGGFAAGPAPLVEMLRQKARPYLFSNALAPAVVGATLECLDLIQTEGGELRERVAANARHFRQRMREAGLKLAGADHPIVPIMLGDAVLAERFAAAMMEQGVYVTAFSYPVVPHGQARIRTQMSAEHTREDLDRAIDAFVEVGRRLEVVR